MKVGIFMGEGIGYICKKCKKEKQILYGIGFFGYKQYYTEDNFKNLINIAREENLYNYNDFIEFINLKNVDINENYGYDAYICPKCKNIDNKFRYILFNQDKNFIPKYSCKFCDGILRIKKKNEDYKLKCDNCGCEEFEKEPMFLNWD